MAIVGATIRKFNRFELKYIIIGNQAEAFKKSLLPFLIPDRDGISSGKYTLLSLYYDSPNLHCYWEKEYGIKFRRKLRLRHYVTDARFTDETPVALPLSEAVSEIASLAALVRNDTIRFVAAQAEIRGREIEGTALV